MIGIYKITCKANNKIYIGQSTNIHKRLRNHKSALRRNAHENERLQYSWNKYGESQFVFSIEQLCSEDELDKIEVKILKKYGYPDNKKVFNMESGGNKSKHLSEETKNKIRIKHLGTHHTEESKKRISQTLKGIKRSEETKQKMSKARLGTHPSPETLKKMSIAASGKNNGHYGKHRSEITKQKIREHNPHTKIVQQFSKDGILIAEFLGTWQASKAVNGNQGHISQCCTNKRKTANGYIWKYKKDIN